MTTKIKIGTDLVGIRQSLAALASRPELHNATMVWPGLSASSLTISLCRPLPQYYEATFVESEALGDLSSQNATDRC